MPDFRTRLAAAATVPTVAPEFSSLRERASRRAARRRTASVLAVVSVLVLGTVVAASALSRSSTPDYTGRPAPCYSPVASNEAGLPVGFPSGGRRTRVTVHVHDQLIVAWVHCGELGTITSDDRRDESRLLVSYFSGGECCRGGRVSVVGYRARAAGTVVLKGVGDKGSDGTIEVQILPASDGTTAEPVPTPQSYLKEKDRSRPRARSCPKIQGPVLTLVLGPTSYSPACAAITPVQRLRVVNNAGRDVVVTYGRYPPRTIRAGVAYLFNLQFGYELAYGVHDLPLSGYPTMPELWVYVA